MKFNFYILNCQSRSPDFARDTMVVRETKYAGPSEQLPIKRSFSSVEERLQ